MNILEALQTVESIITGDSVLKSKVSTYENRMALFDSVAPSDAIYPRLIITSATDPLNDLNDYMEYSIEVYDESPYPKNVLDIASRIEYLLFNIDKLFPQHKGKLQIFRNGSYIVPDPSIDIKHCHLGLQIKYGRQDLYVV
jgi:hypothetical protein